MTDGRPDAAPGGSPARRALGVVDLYAPQDWFDVLADDNEPTGEHFADLVARTCPQASREVQGAMVQSMLAWRAALRDQGALAHGVVSAPHPAGGHAAWHVLAGVVDLPEAQDVDLAAVLVRQMEHDLDPEASWVESFETDMGLGVGFLAQPGISPDITLLAGMPTPVGAEAAPVRFGLAAALACPPTGGFGLLVVGACVDPGHVLELAAVVAIIAGRSTIRQEVR
jgi:hypothetical protein